MRQFASYNHFEKFALEHIIGQTFGKYSFGPQDMGQTLETALFGGLIPKGQPDFSGKVTAYSRTVVSYNKR